MAGRRSIAARWFSNCFGVVAVIMLVIVVGVYIVSRTYYYNAVSRYLQSEAGIVAGVLARLYDESAVGYADNVREAVELFDKKNTMELMAINKSGRIALSSSGFSPDGETEMPDYSEALENENGVGEYVGRLSRSSVREKYMAVTVTIDAENADYTAIRVMTSLERVDWQIMSLVLFATAAGFVVLLIVLLLGLFFVKSILQPIRVMADSSRKLAKGDFSERIPVDSDDEIGDLCRAFNYMANGLADSEAIKNDFISSVSHELRTPLTAIKGWSETIMEVQDRETLTKGMKVIVQETERLSSMVEELLDFSRIQNGRLMLQMAKVDVLAELADAILVYTERAAKNNIIINYHEPEEAAIVYGDKNRLRQVFLNIIDNAVKYIGKDGVVSVEAHLDDRQVEIKITDNGCGISKEDLPKVKTRFYKANNTVRGSGIGLAVADDLVTRHDGTLEIASVKGEGTAVTITLPRLQKKTD